MPQVQQMPQIQQKLHEQISQPQLQKSSPFSLDNNYLNSINSSNINDIKSINDLDTLISRPNNINKFYNKSNIPNNHLNLNLNLTSNFNINNKDDVSRKLRKYF